MFQSLDWSFFKPFVLTAVVCFTVGFVGYWALTRESPQTVEFISEKVVPPGSQEPEPQETCNIPGTNRTVTCRQRV